MTAFNSFEQICHDVHESWMSGQRAHGRESAQSRHGTGELMIPYTDLEEVDKDDDRRVVRAVLTSLSRLHVGEVWQLIAAMGDEALLGELRDMFVRLDPVPAGLADRCNATLAGEDAQR